MQTAAGNGRAAATTSNLDHNRTRMDEREQGIRLNGRFYPAEAFMRFDVGGHGHAHPSAEPGAAVPDFQADGIPEAVVEFLCQWWSSRTYILAHTSGSTGRPRSIRLSRDRMRASAQLTADFFHFRQGMPALLALDARHIAGKMMLVRALWSRLDLWVTPPTSRPDLVYPEMRFTFCPLVPTQLWRMLEANGDVRRLGTLLLGAAPISADRIIALESLKQEVFQGFGMTETCSHMALRQLNPQGDGIYRALPGVNWRVDQEGCLLLRGAATANRWIHTHDRVQLDGDGFRWLGRADWVINVGGLKVHPEQVEERLNILRLNMPELHSLLTGDFVVLGRSDPYKGQVPICVVEDPSIIPNTPNPYAGALDTRYSPDCLKPHLKAEEIPRIMLRIPQFPRSSMGKILRGALYQKIPLFFETICG